MKRRTLNPEIKSYKRYVGLTATSTRGTVGTIQGVKTATNGRKVFFGKTVDGRPWQSQSPKLVD